MRPELRLSFSAIEAISEVLREYGAEFVSEAQLQTGTLQEVDYVRRIAELIAGDV